MLNFLKNSASTKIKLLILPPKKHIFLRKCPLSPQHICSYLYKEYAAQGKAVMLLSAFIISSVHQSFCLSILCIRKHNTMIKTNMVDLQYKMQLRVRSLLIVTK